jgi:hypothetical protein
MPSRKWDQLQQAIAIGKSVADIIKVVGIVSSAGIVSVVVSELADTYNLLSNPPHWIIYTWPAFVFLTLVFLISLTVVMATAG